jgi:hypothetical protein
MRRAWSSHGGGTTTGAISARRSQAHVDGRWRDHGKRGTDQRRAQARTAAKTGTNAKAGNARQKLAARRAADRRAEAANGSCWPAQRGERNRLLFWASLRIGELVAEGDLDAAAAGQALTGAAAQAGLAGEDG